MKILVADDDLELSGLIAFALRQGGFTVVEAPDGGDALAVRRVGVLSLGFDHAAVDLHTAARFVTRVRDLLETRDWLTEAT